MLFDAIPHIFCVLDWRELHGINGWADDDRGDRYVRLSVNFFALFRLSSSTSERVYNIQLKNFLFVAYMITDTVQSLSELIFNCIRVAMAAPDGPLYIFKSVELIESATYIYHALWFFSLEEGGGDVIFFWVCLFVVKCLYGRAVIEWNPVSRRSHSARGDFRLYFFRELPLDLYRKIYIYMLVERRVYILVRDIEREFEMMGNSLLFKKKKEGKRQKSGRRWDAVAAAPDAGSLVSVS